ncbi:MAG: hypothetical protein PHD15_06045 [Clostridia bacterium]|nr:hypothetical protein [Clostridia bacterium]MDD4387292.1 hypothetical protein [Clostridia bacterium]
MKGNKLYNIMFPIWFLLVFPITWLVVIPVNFIIDTIVVLAGLKYFKANNTYETYKKIILKIWFFGFIANLIGSAVLFLTQFLPNGNQNSLYNSITSQVAWNPFNSIESSIIVLFAIFVSMILIYIFNYKISFKKVGLERKTAKKLAALLAIVTAPWVLLFPSQLLYDGIKSIDISLNEEMIKEIKSIEIKDALNGLEGSMYIEDGVFDSNDFKVSVNCNVSTNDNNLLKEYKSLFESESTNKLLNENATKIFSEISYVNDVIFKVSEDKIYTFNRNNMK